MTMASPFESLPGGWLAARRTLVLVGNLPVMNGLWLSQYADREARENAPPEPASSLGEGGRR